MMKKILVLLCIMVFALSVVSQARSFENEIPIAWKSIMLENASGTTKVHIIPTSTIGPGNAILGYVIVPFGVAHVQAEVALYDGAGAESTVSDELFDEAEKDIKSTPIWFMYPRRILTQLRVHVGAWCTVIVYWE